MNIETLHNELGVAGKVTLSKTAYPIEALLKVAYDFTGEFYVYIGENGENYEVNIALPITVIHLQMMWLLRVVAS